MGLRCTLFGHTYGDSEIEREREERGDEAVVTIREIEICDRCGTRTVVSENKEVSSIAEPSVDAAPASEPDPAPLGGDDGGVDAAVGPEHDPETDDGVILEDETDEEAEEPEGRQYGEWPDADEDHASADADPVAASEDGAPAEWPDAEADDEGFDASTPADEDVDAPGLADANVPEEDRGEGDDAAAEETAGADPAVAEGEDVEFLDVDDASAPGDATAGGTGRSSDAGDDDTGMQSAGDAPSPAEPSTAGTELHCPACGYRDDSTDGSLREGDICPECKQGYLAASE